MNILVTGAGGFIGRRLIDRLLVKGHKVVASGLTPGKVKSQQFRYLAADLTQIKAVAPLVEGIDCVVHSAGRVGVWGPKSEYVLGNVVATDNLLQCSKRAGVKRFINLSSASIYFDYKNQLNLKEDFRPSTFSNAYAETKFEAEQLVSLANSDQFFTISLRPRGVVGVGDRSWLPRIIELRRAGKLVQPGNGENLADFTALENLVDAIELCLETGRRNGGKVFNITDGSSERLWDVIEFALKRVGLDGQRRRVPVGLAMALARASELYHVLRRTKREPEILPMKVAVASFSMTLDISAAKSHLGYVPKMTSRQAIEQFCQWWKMP